MANFWQLLRNLGKPLRSMEEDWGDAGGNAHQQKSDAARQYSMLEQLSYGTEDPQEDQAVRDARQRRRDGDARREEEAKLRRALERLAQRRGR